MTELEKELIELKNKLDLCENLLSEAHDFMDDVHGGDSRLYGEISEYFEKQ